MMANALRIARDAIIRSRCYSWCGRPRLPRASSNPACCRASVEVLAAARPDIGNGVLPYHAGDHHLPRRARLCTRRYRGRAVRRRHGAFDACPQSVRADLLLRLSGAEDRAVSDLHLHFRHRFAVQGRVCVSRMPLPDRGHLLSRLSRHSASARSGPPRTWARVAATLLRRVVLPAALPSIFTGLRIALPISIIVIVLTEMIGDFRGLGYYISVSSTRFEFARCLCRHPGDRCLRLCARPRHAVAAPHRVALGARRRDRRSVVNAFIRLSAEPQQALQIRIIARARHRA